jgi:outer membrane protein assembly factor BamB
MPDPRKLIPQPQDPVLYAGTVTDGASADGDLVHVSIPAIGARYATTALTWPAAPGGARPQKGDAALVAIDDQGQEWLVAFRGADA